MNTFETIAAIARGELDLIAYLSGLCERIEKEEPELFAMVPETYAPEKILHQARQLLQKYPVEATRPPLFGVPVGVKDIFRVEEHPTRCGSNLPFELFAGEEACCVSRLKQAGCIIMGKTVTTEFACFHPGPTRNPHHPGHTPGGSSSGSAAGVAKGYFPFALGTQTAGSIVRPASYCGVFGLKPSYDRISLEGVFPFSPSADHVGIFCCDLAGLVPFARNLFDDWRESKGGNTTQSPVYGIPGGFYLSQVKDYVIQHFENRLTALEDSGIRLRKITLPFDIKAINLKHQKMIGCELAMVHAAWIEEHGELYAQKTMETIKNGSTIGEMELQELRAGRFEFRQEVENFMESADLDYLLCPATTDHAPYGLESTGSPIMNLPWTYAGLPCLSIPSGFHASGLSLGMQVVGRYGTDERMLDQSVAIANALKC
ncbi:amidase [Candidatus Riflebacteria bacterium]